LEGALLGGGALDWTQYQGKVVLVDFWASWCGPCQAELPNVLEMYRAYHDKGFEVIGICLDDEPEPAEAFLKKQQIPWKTLFSDDPQRRGWEDPRAVEYGVTGIPLAILLDREGRVVSMNARGEELGRQLQQLLGDPLAAAPAAGGAAVEPPLRQVSSEP
jgi:thiol-disulfide isomerase/thioredoxin